MTFSVKMDGKTWHVISKKYSGLWVRMLMQDGSNIIEGIWDDNGKLKQRISGNCYDLDTYKPPENKKEEEKPKEEPVEDKRAVNKNPTALDILRGNC
jgi:hypothetical protein